MNKEKKQHKINRIAKCLNELLNDSLSMKNTDNLWIPLEVLQNLIYDETIDTGSRLDHECYVSSQPDYTVLHSYSAGALIRDYLSPAIELIIPTMPAHKGNAPHSLRFPISPEIVYDRKNHNKLLGYRFRINKELYLAQRIDAVMRYHAHNAYRKFSVSHRIFNKLLNSSRKNISKEFENQKYEDWENPYISTDVRDSFIYAHILPTLKALNEIATQASYDFRYSLLISCDLKKRNTNQVTYHFTVTELETPAESANLPTNSVYFGLKHKQPITYYKMSKWAYLIHVYLMHLFRNTGEICLEETLNGRSQKNYIKELSAEQVWDFWYHMPIRSNSFLSDFDKAVEELNNIYISLIRSEDYKQRKVFILPDTLPTDQKYGIMRYYNKPYSNPNVESDCPTIYSEYNPLYQITPDIKGTYHVTFRKRHMDYLLRKNYFSQYPKEFAHISSKTSYSQMRLYETLYDSLPYNLDMNDTLPSDSAINYTYQFMISELAFLTGKLDFADWKINKCMVKHVDPASNEYMNEMYKECVKNKLFAYDFYRFFIVPSIKTLNDYLLRSGINYEYQTEFCEDEIQTDSLPTVSVTLVPLNRS